MQKLKPCHHSDPFGHKAKLLYDPSPQMRFVINGVCQDQASTIFSQSLCQERSFT
ncbi:hypothetical protein PBNK5_25200 [Pectobacterium brasiliense]